MMFKRERLFIRIAAILGIVGIVLIALLYALMYFMKNSPEMEQALKTSGQQIKNNYFTTGYFITTILSILVVVALFIIANKLNKKNYKTMGIILIILGIISFWLLWFAPTLLMIIAGILVLVNKEKDDFETPISEPID